MNDDNFDDFYSGNTPKNIPLPKGSSDRKETTIHFRISVKDKEAIQKKADFLGISVSEFLLLAAKNYGKNRKR